MFVDALASQVVVHFKQIKLIKIRGLIIHPCLVPTVHLKYSVKP